jgi:hypothetical protein
VLVVCVGGGIPVILDHHQRLDGIEAVIDKHLSTALLAAQLDADALLMLTDVPNIQADWRTPQARPLTNVTTHELRKLKFAPGSIAPNINAAFRFIDATGRIAAIGALADAPALLRGERRLRQRPPCSAPTLASRGSSAIPTDGTSRSPPASHAQDDRNSTARREDERDRADRDA